MALISATNFATMICVARAVAPREFGAFTLVYAALLLGHAVMWALVTQPHNVLGTSQSGIEYARYTSATALTHVGLSLTLGLLFAGAGAVLVASERPYGHLLLLAAPALIAWQVQEFLRRVFYTEGRVKTAFWNDVLCYGGQGVAVVAVYRAGMLTSGTTLILICATSALAAFAAAWNLRSRFVATSWRPARTNFSFGKWLLGAEAANWLSLQIYPFLAALVLGAAATGALKAALVLLGPLNVLLAYLNTMLPIKLAQTLSTDGEEELNAALRKEQFLVAVPIAVYCLAVSVFARPLLDALYADRYHDQQSLVALLSLYYVLIVALQTMSAALRALRRTRAVFRAAVFSTVSAVVLGWALMRFLGLEGAAIGMVLSALVANLVCWRDHTRRGVRRDAVPLRDDTHV